MIKIYNEKSIKEINELRDKGLYNAPFGVLEAMGKVKLPSDSGEVDKKIELIKDENAMAAVTFYQMVEEAKKEILDEQAKAIVDVYKSLGGM